LPAESVAPSSDLRNDVEEMFVNRALAARAIYVLISLTFLFCGLVDGRAAVTQELSPTILRLIPGAAERLHSGNIYERISVLDELVTPKRDSDVPGLLFRYDLPASDYSVVVKSILAGKMEDVDEKRASTTWWKINQVVRVFRLKEVVPGLTAYLLKSVPGVQLDILQTIGTL
jgi:hypothetical protein